MKKTIDFVTGLIVNKQYFKIVTTILETTIEETKIGRYYPYYKTINTI